MEVWRQLAVQVNGWARYNGFTNLSKTCMVDQCVETAHGVLWWAPGNRTLRIFLKATSLRSKVASQPTILGVLGWRVERLGHESGVWGGWRILSRSYESRKRAMLVAGLKNDLRCCLEGSINWSLLEVGWLALSRSWSVDKSTSLAHSLSLFFCLRSKGKQEVHKWESVLHFWVKFHFMAMKEKPVWLIQRISGGKEMAQSDFEDKNFWNQQN
jgi:hypothetical protein